ncbi:MAG: NFACT RNA binding domain-containing protein [Clostridia bacterium]
MPFDGITVFAMANELNSVLEHCKIEKVNQPTKDEIVLTVRKKGFNHKLLINVSSNNPRVHFLKENRENPKVPPMFCMLLRKHLAGSVITGISTSNFERLMKIEVLAYDEMGFQTKKYLIIELMGKFSNLILTQSDNMIIDCAKRVDFESSVRPLLPNIYYENPPAQEKISILDVDESFAQTVENSDDFVAKILGVSPIIAKSICKDDKICENILNFKEKVQNNELCAHLLYKNGKPQDFSVMAIDGFDSIAHDNFSFMLCDFYEQKEKTNALKSVHKELSRTVKNLINRQTKKLVLQNEELEDTAKRVVFQNYGDLIVSNLYCLSEQKSESITLINYFDENMPEVEIPLDITLTPKQNADKYFLKYNKLKHAEQILTEEIIKGEQNLIYLESVLESIDRTENTQELEEIKNELIDGFYIKKSTKLSKKPKISIPNRYISSDGFVILAGKNNVQNDTLTLKTASRNDMWFHTQKIHGTHVILQNGGQQVPETTLNECFMIAAYNSKARSSSNVPVDYCPVSHVRKPRGSKAGMVIYDNYNTAYVTPDAVKIEELRVK